MRAVLFDLDDTLVDIKSAIVRCIAELCEARAATMPREADIRVWHARFRDSRAKLARWIVDSSKAMGEEALSVIEVTSALRDVGRHVRRDEATLAALETLSGRFRLGIVTNGNDAVQRSKWRAAGLAPWIPATRLVTSGQHRVRKPDRRLFELGLASVGAAPVESLFVGDDECDDILGARDVGMRTCRVAVSGTATAADLCVPRAADIVEHLPCWT